MPSFRLSKAFGVGRRAKVFFNLQGGLTRGAIPNPAPPKEQAENLRKERLRNEKQRKELLRQRLEISQLRVELHAVKEPEESARQGPAVPQIPGESAVGALPDFVVIGAPRCGTSQFYGLLTRHPNVMGAAAKEIHYFDRPERLNKGVEWYRRCFPTPQWNDERRSITGEATPRYLSDPLVPERMAQVIPEARLIVLLRNPVERAYSHYHLLSRRGNSQSFEELIETEQVWLLDEGSKPSAHKRHGSVGNGPPTNLLTTGLYVDNLLRWREFFSNDQTLVLKSENFFKSSADTLELVQDFLGLPHHELKLPSRKSKYQYKPMDPATRQRLEAFFEPYNQRLYKYLGVDFGW